MGDYENSGSLLVVEDEPMIRICEFLRPKLAYIVYNYAISCIDALFWEGKPDFSYEVCENEVGLSRGIEI
jgi:hypothetical protein